ncbi:MAG TPA: carboxypeptidase-like regulatory domain-containing protein [Acidobacteriaceae bacterium]|nr:carboxypeptidase-like regulatory domain-containing protein [Acidobacteriaceae bacterium]
MAAWWLTTAGLLSYAQSPAMHRDGELSTGAATGRPLLDAPEVHAADAAARAICGTVLDVNGAEVGGATVELESASGGDLRDITTDNNGFFRFSSVTPGSFKVSVTAKGFSNWSSDGLMLRPNEDYDLPPVELRVAMSTTEVVVAFTRRDIAEEEIHEEEKQRVLGAIPNFYVSYVSDPEPLSSGQKYRVAWKTSIDPISIAISAGIAGVEQSQDDFNGYGQGGGGYAKRFGAVYADGFVSTFLADAVFPSLLHQDPRYFYKGTGSIRSRALHAIASVVICNGDKGRWQPNYSNVLGNLRLAG